MTRYLVLKLALAAIGVILLGYGMSVNDPRIRWIGIAFLAAAVLTRFLPKHLRSGDYPRSPPPEE
ncbi:MAG TPA: hypothetical protein VKH19_09355 [Gemmatimonadaceae bacterium]|nr:hypothetical protein [Gemmatimonadaceae bacterium]